MTVVLLELALILILLLGNGVFAMTEISIVSSRRALLQARADAGSKGAALALELADSPNRFLSTVQIGITLVGILAGAFGGAEISQQLAALIAPLPGVGEFSKQIAFALVIGLLTYLSLVIGELVPKRIAMRYPEEIASRMALPMARLSKVAAPVVSLLSWSTSGLLRIFRVKDDGDNQLSREDFTVLVREGMVAGTLDHSESRMMEGVFGFEKLDAYDLMIPRPKMVWIEQEASHDETWPAIVRSTVSFFPVYQGNRDNLVGVVSVKDCYAQLAAGLEVRFRHLMQPPLVVPEVQKASVLLETFRRTGNHVAFVANEFGQVIGMVTLTDLMEAILGDVPSKEERRAFTIQRRADGSYLIDGLYELSKLSASLEGYVFTPGEGEAYQTLAGLFSPRLARIPAEGDVVEDGGWKFEIVDMDGIRVDKVLAWILPVLPLSDDAS